ncbi:collagen-like triple helix repeat-containing protein [Nocardioides campestrisoli]|uniref:collagen-like triple helix repeat-containing protein n=1 Tax=Nocardioides campestrisoli TaxID=2736757 RepID=UPI00163D3FF7|nr:collagen-like protein [Nocardioides campestrisoli]
MARPAAPGAPGEPGERGEPGTPGAPQEWQAGGLTLRRTEENLAEIDELAQVLGGRAGLGELLGDLRFQARRSLPGRLLGRAVDRAIAFDSYDQRDRVWWPQGVTTSADASDSELVAGRRVLVTSWYAKPVDGVHRGSRLTFLDLETLRYRHVLLVDVRRGSEGALELSGVRIHAGGVVWAGPYLHVAATGRGFLTFHLDDLMRVPGDNERPDEIGIEDRGVASFGHHHVLPVRSAYRAEAEEGHERLRYSFLSLDRSSAPPALVVGEYGRGRQTTRLARVELDPATWLPALGAQDAALPLLHRAAGPRGMQGVVVARGRHHVSVSRGPWTPGSLHTGTPGALREHRWALPMGPEDLAYWPSTDRLWTVTEHPHRRWLVSVPRARLDPA